MARRAPEGPAPPPAVQRLRVRYAKRGRLRFTSHRDFQRALERALRRAHVPMAYSAGFTPHPKVSYLGAAPTGVASEAEYLELAVAERVDPEQVRAALDAALPAGLDVVEVVESTGGSFADRIDASSWEVRLALPAAEVERALAAFLACAEVPVERLTKDGRRTFDARGPVVGASVVADPGGQREYAILRLVVRHVTPAVRPDDVLSGLRQVADLVPPVPPAVTRLAQGLLDDSGGLADPLVPDRSASDEVGHRVSAADEAGAPASAANEAASSGEAPVRVVGVSPQS